MIPPQRPGDLSPLLTPLVGAAIEGPLYGLNVAMYIICARMLLKDVNWTRRYVLLCVATLQLVLATGHILAFYIYVIRGFTIYINELGGPAAYLADVTTSAYAAHIFFNFTNYILADGMMGWRCYVVWGYNNYVAVFFAALVTASTTCLYITLGYIHNVASAEDIFTPRITNMSTAGYSLSLSTQLCATILISWKLLTSRTPLAKKQHLAIVWVIVESGLLLTVASIAVLTTFELKLVAGQITTNVNSQISALIPTSIVVRAGMERAKRAMSTTYAGSNMVMIQRSQPSSNGAFGGTTTNRTNATTYFLSDRSSHDNKGDITDVTSIDA